MKRTAFVTVAALIICIAGIAQVDSTSSDTAAVKPRIPNDTIHVGNMIIIRKGGDKSSPNVYRRNSYNNENIATNWFIVDLGFSRVTDNTNYAQSIANGYLAPNANSNWFKQRNFKSTNVNIWVFMQRLNLIKHVVNLKYGAGVELNNYKYQTDFNTQFQKSDHPLVMLNPSSENYRKNKLAADYLTVPVMLNFNLTPKRRNAFGFSAGASVGYLYSSRQKTIGGGHGKTKLHDDFDLHPFKISYIAEVNMGPFKLYASYATESMFKKALDQTPYTFGIRLSQ